jgi:3-phosphoshikimate 1-carboxyvinyltransferase
MVRSVGPSRVDGRLDSPPSKSDMIRAVGSALLASGTTHILNPSLCDDSLAALRLADRLGAAITEDSHDLTVTATGGLKAGHVKSTRLPCGESGLCMRMFAPIAALADETFVLEGSGSLLSRPMGMMGELSSLGGQWKSAGGYPPITVRGPIRGGRIGIDGSQSSQFLTGLLMALPLCAEDSLVEVTGLRSRPYIAMTIDTLARFGVAIDYDGAFTAFSIRGNQRYRACSYTVEGDWSSAAFLLVAGAIAGKVHVDGLRMDSHQADRRVLEALTNAGAAVITRDDTASVGKGRLQAFRFDAQDCPDLVPPLVALAAHCEGTTVITGTGRLKYKESNRALSLASEFTKLGVPVRLFEEQMEIDGGTVRGCTVDSHNDHRIAMACAVAALNGDGDVIIERPECVVKSYPAFFDDLDRIGVAS